jgi:hypothetical protein
MKNRIAALESSLSSSAQSSKTLFGKSEQSYGKTLNSLYNGQTYYSSKAGVTVQYDTGTSRSDYYKIIAIPTGAYGIEQDIKIGLTITNDILDSVGDPFNGGVATIEVIPTLALIPPGLTLMDLSPATDIQRGPSESVDVTFGETENIVAYWNTVELGGGYTDGSRWMMGCYLNVLPYDASIPGTTNTFVQQAGTFRFYVS